jgi:hypothetical protein
LHTADPSTTGANELTGGSPAYARKAVTWSAAATAAKAASNAPVFDVGAGKTITHWGMWSTATGGTFYYGGTLPASETFGSQGTYTATSTTLTATG